MEEEKKPRKRKKTSDPAPGGEQREHKKNWRELFATPEDIKQMLSERVMLRYNEVRGRTEIHRLSRGPVIREDANGLLSILPGEATPEGYHSLTDRDVNTLWTELSAVKPLRRQDLQAVVESDYVPSYHPFRFYLEQLPPWRPEQGDEIMTLSLTVNVKGGADEQLLFYEYLRKWLVATVASWVSPEVVNNVMLVLIGEQGSYKTTWLANLLPPQLRDYFYTKTNSALVSRDDLLTLAQYGLVCWEELDTMRPSELNKLKAAMTMPSINERAAYARYHECRPHLASFCGTGNNVQFLSDTTGTRRWLPFEVDSIESPLAMPFNHDAIFSQAYTLYRQGFRYWFDRAEIERLLRHNEQFETVHSELELVDLHFRKPVGQEPCGLVSATMALQLIGGNIAQTLSKEKIGHAFARLGFEYRRKATQRGYIAVHRTGAEMEAYRRQLAADTAAGVTGDTAAGMTDDSMTAVF